MKIDLHCHTKKTKTGDKETRNVEIEKFVETLSQNDVRFVAITNHNVFDKEQYEQFKYESLKKNIDVWPGIELDVSVNGEKGHMIVISNPDNYVDFSNIIDSIIGETLPDVFCVDIEKLIDEIGSHDIMIIAHHSLKDHGFSENAIEKIKELIEGKMPLMFEPSSLKTVGIMYANGINGFIGSDVTNWNNYPANKIPTLKMDIKNYDTFKLLIKKDCNTIETFLNQKEKNCVTIHPFSEEGDNEELILKLYNDVNIVFGGKGTGKSKIIESLNKYYKEKYGNSNVEYYPGQKKEADYEKLIKRNIKREYFNDFNIADCKNEFQKIKDWQDIDVTPISSFVKGFQTKNASPNFMKFGFRTAEFSDIIMYLQFDSYLNRFQKVSLAVENLLKEKIDEYLIDKEFNYLKWLLNKIKREAQIKLRHEWVTIKSMELEKFTIDAMKDIGKSKTGNSSIPSSIGFSDFCSSLFNIHLCAKNIYNGFSSNRIIKKDYIGTIPEKGKIYVQTEIYLNPNEATSVQYQNGRPTVSILKSIFDKIEKIYNETFTDKVNEHISSFNSLCSNNCASLRDCFGIKTSTCKEKNGRFELYTPSSGEKSMLLLNNVLVDDRKNVYILDEPELSVGHKYINEVIVPRLKDLAAMDKIIIISTHDANIAVRTLPLMTIYREYKKTYVGNLFIDELEECNSKEKIRWTDTSMLYLEGGDWAFKERGDSYGI